ncbi:hypothetical protein GCM10023232_20780 [Sphingosinicella ginsenosidimutans]
MIESMSIGSFLSFARLMHGSAPEEKSGTGERRRPTRSRAGAGPSRQPVTRAPIAPGRPGVTVVVVVARPRAMRRI